jgi:hypothetical protein
MVENKHFGTIRLWERKVKFRLMARWGNFFWHTTLLEMTGRGPACLKNFLPLEKVRIADIKADVCQGTPTSGGMDTMICVKRLLHSRSNARALPQHHA